MPSLKFYAGGCVAADVDEYRSASASDVLLSLARLCWLRIVRPGHLTALTARFDGRAFEAAAPQGR